MHTHRSVPVLLRHSRHRTGRSRSGAGQLQETKQLRAEQPCTQQSSAQQPSIQPGHSNQASRRERASKRARERERERERRARCTPAPSTTPPAPACSASTTVEAPHHAARSDSAPPALRPRSNSAPPDAPRPKPCNAGPRHGRAPTPLAQTPRQPQRTPLARRPPDRASGTGRRNPSWAHFLQHSYNFF